MRINNYISAIYVVCAFLLTSCSGSPVTTEIAGKSPVIFPDYKDVTIPVEIAPLNFRVETDYARMDVVFEGSLSGSLRVGGNRETTRIPEKAWRRLLEANRGGDLRVSVSTKKNGRRTQYEPFLIHISPHPIDYGIAYRLIAPGYEVFSKMGIYERSLADFRQQPVIENTLLTGTCMNCHSFREGDPSQMSLHIRGAHGGTIISRDGELALYDTKTDSTVSNCVYPYWHPSGRFVAYSVNETRQVFHARRDKRIEVVDVSSDVVVFDAETGELLSCPQLKSGGSFETFPAFSPDGKSLYFCSAEAKDIPGEYSEVRYNLCRIAFDSEAGGSFGVSVDTLVNASTSGKSVSFPRPSYDGRFLIYTLSDYGNFSIWHEEADLWLLDLATGESRPLAEINSSDTESYHSWSSNSRWLVFSSRRIDGLYTRPFIAAIDEQGRASKPFLLPQRTPSYYDETLFSFNVPEFITAPVKANISEMEKKIVSSERRRMNFR